MSRDLRPDIFAAEVGVLRVADIPCGRSELRRSSSNRRVLRGGSRRGLAEFPQDILERLGISIPAGTLWASSEDLFAGLR